MSGHSKWSQIKRQKGATDKKRGALFTKLGNAVTIAAREGGGDPDANFKLRLTIDKAKSANMPKENIERAIKRGTGELEGATLQEFLYEGFGPGGVVLVIKALSDNKNRTSAEIKHILSTYHGNLGAPGSGVWQFKEHGILRIEKETVTHLDRSIDELYLRAIDLGADDVKEEGGAIVIYTPKESFESIKTELEKLNITIDYAEIELIPDTTVTLGEKEQLQLEKLLLDLDDNADVSDYYHNASM